MGARCPFCKIANKAVHHNVDDLPPPVAAHSIFWLNPQDQIRVSKKTVDPEKPQLGLIDRWYHTACFVGSREELDFKPEYSGAQLKGFNALKAEDKEELKKRLPPVKAEG